MKIRKGFVSNSSSSSFVCDVCNYITDFNMDPELADYDMYCCKRGHVFCESHLPLTDPEFKKKWEDHCEGSEFSREELDCAFCPICNFLEISNTDYADYFNKSSIHTKEIIFAEIKKVNKRRKVLHNNEYVESVCKHLKQSTDEVVKGVQGRFGTYEKFREFLKNTPVVKPAGGTN